MITQLAIGVKSREEQHSDIFIKVYVENKSTVEKSITVLDTSSRFDAKKRLLIQIVTL